MRGRITDVLQDTDLPQNALDLPGNIYVGNPEFQPARSFQAQINNKVNFLEKRTQTLDVVNPTPHMVISLDPDQPRVLDHNGISPVPNAGIYRLIV